MNRLFTFLIALFLFTPQAVAQADKDSGKTLLETPEEVLEANVEATGGRAACEAVHSMQITATRISDSPFGGDKITSTVVESVRFPGYLRAASEMDTPMGTIIVTRVRTPEASWVEAGPMGRRELPLRPSLTAESACPELIILDNPAYAATGLETELFDGHEVYIVIHLAGSKTLRRYYDQESLLLLAAERISAGGPDDAEPELVKYRDYEEVGGLLLPFAQDEEVTMTMISRTGNGEETETTHRGRSSVTVDDIVINPDLDDGIFSSE